jgi:hypothetical protein
MGNHSLTPWTKPRTSPSTAQFMALSQIQYINMREAVGGGASQPSALDELQQQLPHL